MLKGFPRPRIQHNGKAYPLPYTAQSDNIAYLDDPRVFECVNGGLCLVCGSPVGDECYALLNSGNFFAESGPFHEKCIRMTFGMCPAIKANKHFSFVKMKTDIVIQEVSKWWKKVA